MTGTLHLNAQQRELLARSLDADEADDLSALLKRAVLETARGEVSALTVPAVSGRALDWRSRLAHPVPTERELLEEFVLEPGTGKALEVRAGELVRIEQIEGAQCVDFNVFNLHDYREFFHTGRTRTLHGINPGAGDVLWSSPPRERAMMFILTDTVHCNDVVFPRCSANLYETAYGFATHTNCADIQAEAQREYGLTPDDVHDSFNLFMATSVDDGMPGIHHQSSKPGDHVELLALMDVLAVPNICGADVMKTSNFSIKPVLVQRWRAGAADLDAVPELRAYDTQRTVEQFRQPVIRQERALQRDLSYVPAFANTPIHDEAVEVQLDTETAEAFAGLWRHDLYATEGEALRDVLLAWWAAAHRA
ncbi:urea carboxylase-associated family protein [Herbiconiux sp. CPCC 203407]|uniref:Urea carboxylase-associated family protein n=1 Tax=Herbiconiux oxytropis TaxID=2970915 RepID=A0AA41XFY1_9MICO|nr:urea carboxylase-associated family protein [Herbiconiux oxytropis]MCS5723545.1 urea carboxylase-associated family protein [Herbiconiux oxytropis]MCS5727471.1 urea carboxylase-associated family protein [Herbiconiux oxytropis]